MADFGASASALELNMKALTAQVQVLIPLPISGTYDYRVPPGLQILYGSIVRVPLGTRTVNGVVWAPATKSLPEKSLKFIIEKYECPPLSNELRQLVRWVSDYTLSSPGSILQMIMRGPISLDPLPLKTGYQISHVHPNPLTPARQRVLKVLKQKPLLELAELSRRAETSTAVIKRLVATGAILTQKIPEKLDDLPEIQESSEILLSNQQTLAAEQIKGTLGQGFSATLLDGVTGSGKTEVYFEAIAQTLASKLQVLVLVPEIALTAQWLERFERRFGFRPIEWHSGVSKRLKQRAWRNVIDGRTSIVVGARSALFLPFSKLGLIVVDEEHDSSFKQTDGVIYNARDTAVVRASIANIPIVLSSATPSLETAVNVERQRYGLARLPARHGSAVLPVIEAIDMRTTSLKRGQWISDDLVNRLVKTFEASEQGLLFLNRRGYAPLTLCRACGHRLECPNCSTWLVEHRLESQLRCHYCGYSSDLPTNCSSCCAEDSFAACGPGVERLAEEATRLFGEAKIDIMASDTMGSPQAAQKLVARMTERKIDLLIGTQIVAKGHHFPYLTTIGVIDADLGLSGGDLRAAERTYQLLHQVAGRAGRAEKPGHVVMQTYMPEHPIMRALASGDRDSFMQRETESRRVHNMPPFGRLAALIVSGSSEVQGTETAQRFATNAPREKNIKIFGPAPAPLALLRGKHRHRLLIKTPRDVNIQAILRLWLENVRVPSTVKVRVDVDPYSFL